MSQKKQAPETAETYRYFIRQMIDEISDANDLWRIYTLVSVKYEKVGQEAAQ